jgi:hypothetical protein
MFELFYLFIFHYIHILIRFNDNHQLANDNNELKHKTELLELKLKSNENMDIMKNKQIEELKHYQSEYWDLIKDVGLKSNVKVSYNTNYIINNFTDAYNFTDIMSKPFTDEEKADINKEGGEIGVYHLINNRCIQNIDVSKQPLHCIDISRSKYLKRENNQWTLDPKAETMLNYTINKVVELNKDQHDYNKAIVLLERSKHRIRKQLNIEAHLKSNVEKEIPSKVTVINDSEDNDSDEDNETEDINDLITSTEEYYEKPKKKKSKNPFLGTESTDTMSYTYDKLVKKMNRRKR